MKSLKKLSRAFTLMLALAASMPISAHDFEVDGIYYSINGDRESVSVTYKGDGDRTEYNHFSTITIPETVSFSGTTYKVTDIGWWAFMNSTIYNVVMPNSIKTIGYSAFKDCKILKYITFSNSLTFINNYAFSGCKELTLVVLPETLEWIGQYAFYGCRSIMAKANGVKHEVIIPDNVTYIGKYAFFWCDCTCITIGRSVTSIDEGAFEANSIWHITAKNPVAVPLEYDVFQGYHYLNYDNIQLKVPLGSKESYAKTWPWNKVKYNNIYESDLSGISRIQSKEFKIFSKDGVIRIEGAEGARVEVFNAAGVCIFRGVASEIPVAQRGIYVVKVAGRVTKIAL